MIVVADCSPLNYLVLIGQIHVLPELFGRVIVPQAVIQELQSNQTPPEVVAWLGTQPTWIDIQTPTSPKPDTELDRLGAGEREAIQFAFEHRTDALLLIDEGKGRREAKHRQINIIGTLGILEMASGRDLLNLQEAIERLTKTSFYVAPALLRTLLERQPKQK